MELRNESNEIQYFSLDRNQFVDENTALEIAISFKAELYHNFLSNGLNTLRRPGKYHYFSGLAAVPPGSIINVGNYQYEILSSINVYEVNNSRSFSDLFFEIETILQELSGKSIGVELSGGLDSSLIIEALLKFGVDPILIGFSSEKYEFRTEREVQKVYESKVNRSILIRYEDCFAFDNLKETPKHPIPVSESHFFNRHKTVATVAKKNNIDILFSGEAGDQLLSFPIEISENSFLPTEFSYWCLAEHWSNQYVYKKMGVNYLSGMALGSLPSLLISLRGKHAWDPMKLWARKAFKDCLPRELSDFAYTAFHNRWVSDGLNHASDIIEELTELAFKKFKIDSLDPLKMKKQAKIYSTLEEENRKTFLLNLAFASWYYSILKY
jgi:hypothetical protein